MISNLLFLLSDSLAILCWGRFLLQWAKLPFLHPLAQFCIKSTNWLVRPLRKIAPPLGQWDSACVLAVIIIYYLVTLLNVFLGLAWVNIDVRVIATNLLLSILYSIKALCYVLFLGLVMRMFLSLSKPYSVLLVTLHRIYTPLTRPFYFLRVGNYDFSATVILLILWLYLSWGLPLLVDKLSLWFLFK